jgi:GNAT superfamily N-acetyltransferase
MLIRRLKPADVPAAADICSRNGWPGMPEHFAFAIAHPDCYPFVLEVGRQIVATGSGLRRGAVGWVGQISVLAEHRGRGLGTAMTRHVMETLQALGCRTLRLFATPAGRPIYEQLGFVVDAEYRQLRGPVLPALPAVPELEPLTDDRLSELVALDLAAAGDDRSAQLSAFRQNGWALGRRGFCLITPWGAPLITAADPEAGRVLVDVVRAHFGQQGQESMPIAIPAENTEALAYLEGAGFRAMLPLPRMAWGEPAGWRPDLVWGRMSGAFS